MHSSDFPQITGNDNATFLAKFDNTDAFDEVVVTGYLNGNTSNPLVVGPADTNADSRVFSADGNVTIKALADPTAFKDSCKDILGRMIDTVPRNVKLTDPLTPIPIKPGYIQLTLTPAGSLTFTGRIRVLTSGRTDKALTVSMPYARRDGSTCANCTIAATKFNGPGGPTVGFDAEFYWYDFSTALDAGISHFNVSITSTAGAELYTNGGPGFPIDDSIIYQQPQSCTGPKFENGNLNLTIVAAVHASRSSTDISLDVVERVPRQGVLVPLSLIHI